ncbi:MAG TPA: S9 family peptidase [Holophagaceae bacterium]|nr:S9 family peptidase [Holophagaceae bacterium]
MPRPPLGLPFLLGAALVVPALAAPPRKAPKRYAIRQFMATTSYSGASFSADETRLLLTSNQTGVPNAYALAVKGGALQALTDSTQDSTYGVSYFPKDDRILVTRDGGGNELNHLYVRELDGSLKDLTPGDKLKAGFMGWTKDHTAFYVSTNERDPRFMDVYRYATEGYARTMIYKNEGFFPSDVSPDGRWLSLSKTNTTTDTECHVVDLKTGAVKQLLPHAGRVAQVGPSEFTPDSKGLLVSSNDGSEFSRMLSVDLDTGEAKELEKADWDISACYYSEDGRYRVTAINQDASTRIRVLDTHTGKALPLPTVPVGEVRGLTFSRSGAKAAFYVNGDRSPSNLWVWELKTGQAKPLTRSLSPEVDPGDLVDSRIVRFKSFDGMSVPSVFFLPKGASAQAKVPAVVYVHGGPGGQTRTGYNAQIQYLVNHGYAVLGINNRGSSGYGKTFFAADDGKHGREPLWDCVEAKTFLASMPEIDGQRIGIMGGSYGGYMTLAALAYRPEAFKCGVDIFGVSNWIRTLESIPAWWEAQRQALYVEIGDPVKDREFLKATSPLFAADQIRMPLMVIQGANDPRVIKPESDDVVAAVKKRNVPVEYVVFEDEGHGFSKKKNQEVAYERVLAFLDHHLKGK